MKGTTLATSYSKGSVPVLPHQSSRKHVIHGLVRIGADFNCWVGISIWTVEQSNIIYTWISTVDSVARVSQLATYGRSAPSPAAGAWICLESCGEITSSCGKTCGKGGARKGRVGCTKSKASPKNYLTISKQLRSSNDDLIPRDSSTIS